MKTQGTELYVIDPDNGNVLDVGCVTEITGLEVTITQNEVTCLRDQARAYEPGLGEPGTASFGIYADPQDATHLRLHELYREAAGNLEWAIGWSDGTGIPPTSGGLDSEGEYTFTLPSTRTWITFEGFIANFPFAFAQNTQVTSTINIQVSEFPLWIPKVS
jgi:hypothetical protein